MDPVWLTSALRAAGLLRSARVVDCRRARHAGGFAVTSLVLRLQLSLDQPEPEAPSSVIVKLPNPNFERTQHNCEAEIDFYRTVAARVPLPVPRSYYADYDSDAGLSVLLLEDLSHLRPGHPAEEGCDLAQVRASLQSLAALQAPLWGEGQTRRVGLARNRALSEHVDSWLGDTAKCFETLRSESHYPTGSVVQRCVERSLRMLGERAGSLDDGPCTLVHDDLHIQNTLLQVDGHHAARMFVLDWQDARAGHPALDAAQLLGGNTRPDVQREHGRELLRDYHRELEKRGASDWSYAQMLDDVQVATVRLVLGYIRFLSEYAARSSEEQAVLDHEWGRMVTALAMAMNEAAPTP